MRSNRTGSEVNPTRRRSLDAIVGNRFTAAAERSSECSDRKQQRAWLRDNGCQAEPHEVVLVRGIVVKAAGREQAEGDEVDPPATPSTRRTGHFRFVPLPHVATLIIRAVGTCRFVELACFGAVIRAADC